MHLTPVQDQAIAARMALIVGVATFDRLFSGAEFDKVDGDMRAFPCCRHTRSVGRHRFRSGREHARSVSRRWRDHPFSQGGRLGKCHAIHLNG
jgi:hypothetical protein